MKTDSSKGMSAVTETAAETCCNVHLHQMNTRIIISDLDMDNSAYSAPAVFTRAAPGPLTGQRAAVESVMISHWWSDAAPAQIRLIKISSARDKDSHHPGRQLHYRITAAGVWSNMEASWTQKTKQGGVYRASTGPNRHFQLNSESEQQSSADGTYWLMLHRNTNTISVSFLSLSPLHHQIQSRMRKEHLDLSEDWQSHSPPFPRLSWGKSVFWKWTEPPVMRGMNSQFKVSLSSPVVNIFEANSVWHNRGTDSRYGNRQTSIQQCLQEEIRDLEASSKLVIFLDN